MVWRLGRKCERRKGEIIFWAGDGVFEDFCRFFSIMAKNMTIEEYYNKHKEENRLKTRHGRVEFTVAMKYIHQFIEILQAQNPNIKIADIGAGTGRYSVELANQGFDITAVELVKHNVEIMEKKHANVKIWSGDARSLHFLKDETFDLTIFFGPLYHLHGDEEKLKAFSEVKRITKKGGYIFAGYVMNDYSLLVYCFDQNRICDLKKAGRVDQNFHIVSPEDELYDYVRIDDLNRLNTQTGLKRVKIFSPDGPADFMRAQLNAMSEETFEEFINYVSLNAERPELLGAGSHIVDVLQKT